MKLLNVIIDKGTPFESISDIDVDDESIDLDNVGTDGGVQFYGYGVDQHGERVELNWDCIETKLNDENRISDDYGDCADWENPCLVTGV